jgi:hypothetical protein
MDISVTPIITQRVFTLMLKEMRQWCHFVHRIQYLLVLRGPQLGGLTDKWEMQDRHCLIIGLSFHQVVGMVGSKFHYLHYA